MMNETYSIGVDIGGTKINTGLIDARGQIKAMTTILTGSETGYEVIADRVVRQVRTVLDQAGMEITDLKSMGFGVPGTVNSQAGLVLYAPNLDWREAPFTEIIRREFAIPIALGQDTHAAVWAEFLFGAGVGCRNIACLTIGTGIGCGLVIDQQLYLGGLKYVGEVGHSLVELDGRPCSCGNRGCLEAYASGTAIQKRGRELIEDIDGVVQDPRKGLTTQDILKAAGEGRQGAQQVLDEAVSYLGMGIVNLIHLFGPEKVILSGGLGSVEDLIADPVRAFVKERSYSNVADLVEITTAELGEVAPMIGAAFLYRDHRYQFRS
ncbi:MAG: ROK family protein [Anaerolineales bacterium]|nr:ROK family protein [Anaerolineales bacterium]